MTLVRRLTWKQHILDKSKQLRDKLKKFYWLIGCRSNLSTQNKITLYKAVIKLVWTYGIQLWGTASNSDIEILQRFQLKRKAKAKWQKHRTCENKKHLNKLGKEIKSKIRDHNNNEFSKFIETLSAHKNANYSMEIHQQNQEADKTNSCN